MTTISDAFKKCQKQKRKALIPYLTSGFPDTRVFPKLAKELIGAGADMVEIGIPFSDPMADGKTIQYSSQKALENGVTVDTTFAYVSALRNQHDTPLILMSYYNPINRYGLSKFVRAAAEVGLSGLIVPDLIPEEGKTLERLSAGAGIDLIYLLAPTSSRIRRKLIIRRSSGFVYLVSVAGVTGARRSLPTNLDGWIRQVKREARQPVCVGFGISNARQARQVSRAADGMIIGSAIIDIIRMASSSRQMMKDVAAFMGRIRKGLNHD